MMTDQTGKAPKTRDVWTGINANHRRRNEQRPRHPDKSAGWPTPGVDLSTGPVTEGNVKKPPRYERLINYFERNDGLARVTEKAEKRQSRRWLLEDVPSFMADNLLGTPRPLHQKRTWLLSQVLFCLLHTLAQGSNGCDFCPSNLSSCGRGCRVPVVKAGR